MGAGKACAHDNYGMRARGRQWGSMQQGEGLWDARDRELLLSHQWKRKKAGNRDMWKRSGMGPMGGTVSVILLKSSPASLDMFTKNASVA